MSKYPVDYAILEKFEFERPPVGVKFLPARPKNLKRPDNPLDFCEMLVAAQNGKSFYVTKDDFTCIGAMLLGMVDLDPRFESGQVGPLLGAFKDDRANRRIYQHLPRLARNAIEYVAFAPLGKVDFEPDILIILASVSQAEIFNRARSYTSGEVWTARGTTVAGCAWLYIYPYLTGEINFTITGFGFGMKARRLFPEGRILLTIPWDRLTSILKNLAEMDWVPESYTLGPEGHKKKMQKIREQLSRESGE
ncbi:MAG: DUF169 domain-containing protein [Dehalococcoidales bacterium]